MLPLARTSDVVIAKRAHELSGIARVGPAAYTRLAGAP